MLPQRNLNTGPGGCGKRMLRRSTNSCCKQLTSLASEYSDMDAQQPPGQFDVTLMCAQPVLSAILDERRLGTCCSTCQCLLSFWKPPVLPAGATDSCMLLPCTSMGFAAPKLFSCARYSAWQLCLPPHLALASVRQPSILNWKLATCRASTSCCCTCRVVHLVS